MGQILVLTATHCLSFHQPLLLKVLRTINLPRIPLQTLR